MILNHTNANVIENLCSIRDNDYDNYYDIEDLGDVDGDSDCFSAY